MTSRISRRDALASFLALGVGGWANIAGCAPPADGRAPSPALPDETPSGSVSPEVYADAVDALCDALLPAEYDLNGTLSSAGAREAGVADVLAIKNFVALAIAQGLLPPLPDAVVSAASDLPGAFRGALNATLDARAQVERPLGAFKDLPQATREEIVTGMLADLATKDAVAVVRAACFTAYLGAVTADLGLRDVGFPPFEDFADRRAVSGYPRTLSGRLVGPNEDLSTLAARGELDDYTYDLEPAPTPGDDLSRVLDANGDLL